MIANLRTGCTPRAVKNRLAKMKAEGKAAADASGMGPRTPSSKHTTPAATPATGASASKGSGRGRGKTMLEADPSDDDDLAKFIKQSPSAGRKRGGCAKKNAQVVQIDDEEEEEKLPFSKKIKIEAPEVDTEFTNILSGGAQLGGGHVFDNDMGELI